MNILTKNEKIILKTLKTFYAKEGKMPSMRGLQDEVSKYGLKLKSVGSVFIYLKSLKEKGYIRKNNGKVELINQSSKSFVNLPILGTANAGDPTFFAEENIQGLLKVSNRLAKNDYFVIENEGDSMNLTKIKGKSIESGDYIVVNPNDKNFKNGNRLLVTIDGLATVKRFRKFPDKTIGLFPESTNKTHKPIYLTVEDDFIINGKVVDILKNV